MSGPAVPAEAVPPQASSLQLSVLGGVRASRDGDDLGLGGPRPRALLAALVVPAASPLAEAPLALSSSVGDAPMAVADVQEVLIGFINGGGLIAIPILGAFLIAGGIGFFLYSSSQPIEEDDE